MDNKFLHFGFRKENTKLLLIGLAINVLGYILMIGGGSKDPNVFNEDALFSHMRMTISPMLILAGFVIIIYALMRKPKNNDNKAN